MTAKLSQAYWVEVEVSHLNEQGVGIAWLHNVHGDMRGDMHRQKRSVELPFQAIGDRLRVLIDPQDQDPLTPRATQFLHPGPFYQKPVCKHFGMCGGCQAQHLQEQAYHDWKLQSLRNVFAASNIPQPLKPIFSVPAHSRRRVNLIAQRLKHVVLGFQEFKEHHIVDIQECPIMLPSLQFLVGPLREMLPDMLKRQSIEVFLLQADNGLDVLLQTRTDLNVHQRQILAEFAIRQNLVRLSWQTTGRQVEPVYQRQLPVINIAGVHVHIAPGGFVQPTAASQAYMQQLVTNYLPTEISVVDLFSGIGTFSFPLLQRGQAVLAVEGHRPAVQAMQHAARQLRRPDLLQVAERNLNKYPLSSVELKKFEAVIIDPPRQGAWPQMQALADSKVPYIIAISCYPPTLARDLIPLLKAGYQLEAIYPIDQFLWSSHLEVVCYLRRVA